MTKDKKTTIRINSELNKKLVKDGMTVQKIIDEYLDKHYQTKIIRRKK